MPIDLRRTLPTGGLLVLLAGAPMHADQRAPTGERPTTIDTALRTTDAGTFLAQRGQRRRTGARSSGTRLSWARIVTGASLVVGGVFTARTAHSRLGAINDRNAIREGWNENAAAFEEYVADFDFTCRDYWSDRCQELVLDVLPDLVEALRASAEDHSFLPQMPSVGRHISDEELQELLAWGSTKTELEGTGPWTPTFYSGLAAAGVGALLATIWSDVPVARNLRVPFTSSSLAVTTTVGW